MRRCTRATDRTPRRIPHPQSPHPVQLTPSPAPTLRPVERGNPDPTVEVLVLTSLNGVEDPPTGAPQLVNRLLETGKGGLSFLEVVELLVADGLPDDLLHTVVL